MKRYLDHPCRLDALSGTDGAMRAGFLTSLVLAIAMAIAFFVTKPAIDRDALFHASRADLEKASKDLADWPAVRLTQETWVLSESWKKWVAELEPSPTLSQLSSGWHQSTPEEIDKRVAGYREIFAGGSVRIGRAVVQLSLGVVGSVVLFWLGIWTAAKLRFRNVYATRLVLILCLGAVGLPVLISQEVAGLVLLVPIFIGGIVGLVTARRGTPRPTQP